MSTFKIKNKDGTWKEVAAFGSYEAAAIASEAADRAESSKILAEEAVAKIAKDGYSVAFATVADMQQANLAEGIIVKTAGYYEANDGGGETYIIVKEQTDIALVNGLYAKTIKDYVTIPTANNYCSDLLNCVYSYVDHIDELVYGNNSTETHVAINSQGKKEIDCSLFVWYVTHGIKYEDSIYNGNATNEQRYDYGFKWEGLHELCEAMGHYRFLANAQAKYCLDHKYLFKPSTDLFDLRFGDLLFYDNAVMPDYWEHIGHVAIYLYTDSFGNIVVAEMRDDESIINISFDTSRINYVARLPLNQDVEIQSENLINNGIKAIKGYSANLSGIGNNGYTLANLELKKPLEASRLYTFVIKADRNPPNGYYWGLVKKGGNSILARTFFNTSKDFSYVFTFKTTETIEGLNLYLYAPQNTSPVVFAPKVTFVGVFDGCNTKVTPLNSSEEYADTLRQIANITDITVDNKVSYRKSGNTVEVWIDGASVTSAYSTICTLPLEYRPVKNLYTCGFTGNYLPMGIFVSAASGNIQITKGNNDSALSGNAHFMFMTKNLL